MSSTAPSWAETTVSWLRYNCPAAGLPATSRKPSFGLLNNALIRVMYKRHETVNVAGWGKGMWRDHLSEMSSRWTEANHKDLVEFIGGGGYEVELAEWEETRPLGPGETLLVGDGESISLEMGDDDVVGIAEDVIEEALSLIKPKAQQTPDHELDDIVSSEVLAADPRYGAW